MAASFGSPAGRRPRSLPPDGPASFRSTPGRATVTSRRCSAPTAWRRRRWSSARAFRCRPACMCAPSSSLPTAAASSRLSTFPPRQRSPPPRASRTSIHPSDILPANALKLYVYFSAPMRRGDSWKHLHLLRDGAPVEYPFLELDQELWDRDQRRFTVLFDPGRIKRGLASLAEAGPALEEGHNYTLVIDRDWLDGRGAPAGARSIRKDFRAAAADRIPPDPKKWRVTAPRAGTSDQLVIHFPKPLDYALLQHEIEVTGVTGKVAVARDETEWRFTPDSPWRAGDLQHRHPHDAGRFGRQSHQSRLRRGYVRPDHAHRGYRDRDAAAAHPVAVRYLRVRPLCAVSRRIFRGTYSAWVPPRTNSTAAADCS